MANTHKKKSARGPKQNVKSIKTDLDLDPEDDLITKEDEDLLKGVKDVDEESFDVEASGNDIPESEIVAFLKKLGVQKFRPTEIKESQKKDKAKVNDSNEKKKEPIVSKTKDSITSKAKESIPSKTSKSDEKKTLTDKSNKTPKQKTVNKDNERPKSGKKDAQQKNATKTPLHSGVVPQKQKSFVDKNKITSALNFLKPVTSRKHLLLKPGQAWRIEEATQLPDGPPDELLVDTAEKLAQKLFEEEVLLYSKQRENIKNSEARWLKTVLSSGTLSDKMAALTLLIQESPLHNMVSLDTLISMSSKKGKREAMMAVDTLRDLYLTGLLPDNRKLRAFNQQPLLELQELSQGSMDARDRYLVMWYFEAQLKKKYTEFIKVLGEISFDTLQAMKEKALSTIHKLLSNKPEQENVLLPMLVNKLGDPMIKSKAIYLLTKLVDEHPRMKTVIVREVQQLLHRPNVTQRAQYYAICYLAQIRLSETEAELASQLIHIYFYFFQNFLKKSEVDNKMMSALLTGVNRAYVYAKENKEEIAQQIDAIYKIIPSVNFHTGVQALMLLHQVTDTSASASDRYFMCLYRKLVDPALHSSSKQGIFLNLLFKSLKSDVVDRRIKAFIKRILQVYSSHPPHTICGVLILLSQILQNKAGLIQTCYQGKGAWTFDDDEEEHFIDYPEPEETDGQQVDNENSSKAVSITEEDMQPDSERESEEQINGTKGSWVHRINYAGSGHGSLYDPYVRNPLYTHAETECTAELHQLVRHYHPTVRLYSVMLMKGQPIHYDGDPVKDFTLARFLDRFVYKNPKKIDKAANVGYFRKSGPSGIRAVPVNSNEYLEIGEEDIPEDEKFFYRYFKERALRKQDEEEDDDNESIDDDEFDSYLDSFEKSVDKGDVDDLDLDFASDHKKDKKGVAKEDSSEEEEYDEEDDDEDLDLEDDELAAEFQQEMGEEIDIEEDGHFSPDEDDELHALFHGDSKKKKRKTQPDDDFDLEEPKKKKKKTDTSDLFASAEQFAHLLDEENDTLQGGSSDLLNRDKSAKKQLAWEMDRDRWLHDKKGRSFKGKHKAPRQKSGKGFGKKNMTVQSKQKIQNKKHKK
ncbi:CCAAT/enhancer-binding protein zeta [Biomphalaria glabrata]|nr:CCAAT/enhancer-binding protein zeta [Biomphalaria glabrata]